MSAKTLETIQFIIFFLSRIHICLNVSMFGGAALMLIYVFAKYTKSVVKRYLDENQAECNKK